MITNQIKREIGAYVAERYPELEHRGILFVDGVVTALSKPEWMRYEMEKFLMWRENEGFSFEKGLWWRNSYRIGAISYTFEQLFDLYISNIENRQTL